MVAWESIEDEEDESLKPSAEESVTTSDTDEEETRDASWSIGDDKQRSDAVPWERRGRPRAP